MKREEVIELVDGVSVTGLGWLNVLILLGHATINELVLLRNGDRNSVGMCLRQLEIRGWVERVQSGHADRWFPSGKCLSLMRSPTAVKTCSCAPTTTTALLSPSPGAKAVAAEVPATAVKTCSKPPQDKFDDIDVDLLLAFRAAGIGRNMWRELAELEWVDAEYVRGHAEYRIERGDNIGLMITRMRCGDSVPGRKVEVDVAEEWGQVLERRDRWRADRERFEAKQRMT